jgi:hypothetical protein
MVRFCDVNLLVLYSMRLFVLQSFTLKRILEYLTFKLYRKCKHTLLFFKITEKFL